MSKSKQTSTQSAPTVWGGQSNYLTNLYKQGQDLTNQPALNAQQLQGQQMSTDYASGQPLGQIVSGSQQALLQNLNPSQSGYSQLAKNLGMGGAQGIQGAMNTQGGQDIQGANFSGFGSNNPMLDKPVQAAMNRVNRNFNENILSGITDQAVQAGQTGSSREGVAQAIAARQTNETAADLASQMYGQAYNQDMNRGLQAQQSLAQQNQAQGQMTEGQRQYNLDRSLQASQLGTGMYGQSDSANQQAMQNAIAQSGNVANLGMIPSNIISQAGQTTQQAPWQQLAQYKGLLGSPTVLGGASSSSRTGGTGEILGGLGGIGSMLGGIGQFRQSNAVINELNR